MWRDRQREYELRKEAEYNAEMDAQDARNDEIERIAEEIEQDSVLLEEAIGDYIYNSDCSTDYAEKLFEQRLKQETDAKECIEHPNAANHPARTRAAGERWE